MIRIIADDKIPFLNSWHACFSDKPRAFELVCLPSGAITRESVRKADALLVRTRTQCNESLLKGSRVSFIASATIGHDHIDKDYCLREGIQWQNAPACNADAVLQYMASALAWIMQNTGRQPHELQLGIVGLGQVGSRVHRLAKALGMPCLANDPPRARLEGRTGFCELDELLSAADIISLHVPLTDSGRDATRHLINEGLLSQMKKQAWLINTSRGEVIDSRHIKHALKNSLLKGVILDVWENEPLIDRELLSLSHLGTPHIAGYSLQGKANATTMVVQALSRHFRLGTDDWQATVPSAQDCEVKTENFTERALSSYAIQADSERLKRRPEHFEQLREHYAYRNEKPLAWLVHRRSF